jgi:hypothetical protein
MWKLRDSIPYTPLVKKATVHPSGMPSLKSRFDKLSVQLFPDTISDLFPDELFYSIIVYTPEKNFIFALTPNPGIYLWH